MPQPVHASRIGLQDGADLLWVGDALVVAWSDELDVKWRRFDASLSPLGDERTLSAASAQESAVALAAWDDAPVVAWRAGEAGRERIRVRTDDTLWYTSEHAPAPLGDRPALVALDVDHLLLVYAVGTDPEGTGTAGVGKLRAAIVSRAHDGEVLSMPLLPLSAPYDALETVEQRRPSLARIGDALFLVFESATEPGEPVARELFLQHLGWSSDTADVLMQLEETRLPHGAQPANELRNPRLAATQLYPSGALVALWELHGEAATDRPDPDLRIALRPVPFVTLPTAMAD